MTLANLSICVCILSLFVTGKPGWALWGASGGLLLAAVLVSHGWTAL